MIVVVIVIVVESGAFMINFKHLRLRWRERGVSIILFAVASFLEIIRVVAFFAFVFRVIAFVIFFSTVVIFTVLVLAITIFIFFFFFFITSCWSAFPFVSMISVTPTSASTRAIWREMEPHLCIGRWMVQSGSQDRISLGHQSRDQRRRG